MVPYRVVAIPNRVAELVRSTLRSPGYGHPAHIEVATGHGPCRSCLRDFEIGVDRRILFTYDPFHGIESLPLPGPVFIHESACERFPEDRGFPADLCNHALTLEAYGRGRRPVTRESVSDGRVEERIESLLARADVDYIHVHDTEAGCFDLRIERRAAAEDVRPMAAETLGAGI